MATRSDAEHTERLFVRAEAWLLALVEERGLDGGETSDDLDDLLQVLFGVWLCEQATHPDGPSPSFLALTRCVAESLCRTVTAEAFDTLAHDATLLLLCQRILTEQGQSTCGLAEFSASLNVALSGSLPVPVQRAGAAYFLAQLGYRPYPAQLELSAADAGGESASLLRSDGVRVRQVCDAIAAVTQFGSVTLAADPAVRASLALVLPIILVATLRRNDLETGAAVLRAVRYLRLRRTRAVRQAITFVADQQHGDGKFGYVANEIAAITRAKGWIPFDAERELYLPLTVSCVWSLAEMTIPGFTLVAHSPVARNSLATGDRNET